MLVDVSISEIDSNLVCNSNLWKPSPVDVIGNVIGNAIGNAIGNPTENVIGTPHLHDLSCLVVSHASLRSLSLPET